ncbi:hypothetical protein HELRODRAFT_182790 [Helobdella robusta]|uniref:Uncharacterized protein n=1 Tax=Helobdella robusta TaxID=6412 RepID=T1FIQ8_HELRO|nr:hypothetical protein HELRODRAFT_182790 [Helobdella robusta]ESN90096.1 hypothetical protein HELRODRAFT_182790 [Helobdella robusta]
MIARENYPTAKTVEDWECPSTITTTSFPESADYSNPHLKHHHQTQQMNHHNSEAEARNQRHKYISAVNFLLRATNKKKRNEAVKRRAAYMLFSMVWMLTSSRENKQTLKRMKMFAGKIEGQYRYCKYKI